MAAALLQRALPSMQVSSAGLAACVGHPADPWAIQLMQEIGIDISDHRGCQVVPRLWRAADLILVMDLPQQRKIESFYPIGRGKVARLGHFSGIDVPDPYGAGEPMFRHALQLIEVGVHDWTDRLTRLTAKSMAKVVA